MVQRSHETGLHDLSAIERERRHTFRKESGPVASVKAFLGDSGKSPVRKGIAVAGVLLTAGLITYGVSHLRKQKDP